MPSAARGVVPWLKESLGRRRGRLLVVLVLSLLATGAGLLQPWVTGRLVDDGVLAGNFDLVLRLAGLMVALGVVTLAFGALNRWLYIDLSAEMLHELRERLFAHLLTLPPGYYTRQPLGEITARLDGDLAEVQRFTVDSLLSGIGALLTLVGSVALMVVLSPSLALLALLALPLAALVVRAMRGPMERTTHRVRAHVGVIGSFLYERLQAVKFIQGANAQPRERRRLAEFQRAHRRDLVRQQLVGYTSGALPGFILSLGTAAVFLAGSYQVIEGRFTLGALIAFTAYLARAFAPLRTLLGIGVGWQRARVSLERLAALTDPVSPLHDGAGTLPPVRVGGELAFAGVTFAYPGTDRPVLEGFDARIEPGAKVLVHGPSGAGKSTLVDLLHRHYDPDAGAIRLDGVDLRDCRLDALRREVAVVSQEAVLFDATLRENVAYAVPEADDALVRAALGRAQLGAWLETLPEGLDTRVGTRGTALSGGQRQRVAIARALLQRPRVLVFDEATSALDEATERALLDVIDRLFSSCTRLVVTHRLHAVREPDHVITLAGGEAMALAG